MTDQQEPPKLVPTVFYIGEIVCNEKDKFSGVVLRPGTNGNGYFYSREQCFEFADQLEKVPLVVDHSVSVRANVGKFIGHGIDQSGNVIGNFIVNQSEPEILAKVKDGTIKYMSIAHTEGTSTYCSICGTKAKPHKEHIPGESYGGQTAGIGFIGAKLAHVSLVQMPADMGCSIIQNTLQATAKSWATEAERLQLITPKLEDEIRALKAENERLRALKAPQPEGTVPQVKQQEKVGPKETALKRIFRME